MKWNKTMTTEQEQEYMPENMSNQSKCINFSLKYQFGKLELRFFSPQQQSQTIYKQRNRSPMLSVEFERSYQQARKGNICEFLYADAQEKKIKNNNEFNKAKLNNKQLFFIFCREQFVFRNPNHYLNANQEKQLVKLLLRDTKTYAIEVFEMNDTDNIIQFPNSQKINRKLIYKQVWQILMKLGFFQEVANEQKHIHYTQESLLDLQNENEETMDQKQKNLLEQQYKELNKMYAFLQIEITDLIHIKIFCCFVIIIMGIKLSNKIISQIHQEFPPESLKEPESSQLVNLTWSASTIKSQLQHLSTNHLLFSPMRPASPSSSELNTSEHLFSNQELISHADYLHNESKTKATILRKQRQQKEQELEAMCTFRPEINVSKSREGIAQATRNEKCIKHSAREANADSVDFECTFSPSFISQERKGMVQEESVRETEVCEIQKNVERMQQGRTVRQYLQRAFQRSPETIPKNPMIKNQFFSKQNTKKQAITNIQNQNQQKKQPISIAEVHLSPTQSEKIYIYPGDTSQQLAADFARKHQLDNKIKGKLEEMLEEKIIQKKLKQ